MYKYQYDEEEKVFTPRKLNENRSFLKYLILSILTLGFYNLAFFMGFSFDIDKVAQRHDGKKTMNYLFAFIIGIFTLSIAVFAWFHDITVRMSDEIDKRQIDYSFQTSDFWLWLILGSLILVGPFIYQYKLIKAMNLLSKDYNEKLETK